VQCSFGIELRIYEPLPVSLPVPCIFRMNRLELWLLERFPVIIFLFVLYRTKANISYSILRSKTRNRIFSKLHVTYGLLLTRAPSVSSRSYSKDTSGRHSFGFTCLWTTSIWFTPRTHSRQRRGSVERLAGVVAFH